MKNSLDRADGGLPCASDRHSVPYQKPRPAGDRLVRQSGAGHRGADRRRLVRRDGRGHFAVLRVSARYRPGVFAVGAVRFAGQRRLRRPVCPACRQIPAKKKLPAAYGSMVLAAAAKFAALYLVLVRLVAPAVIPAAKLSTVTAAFTWPQLLTAVIGGVLACLIAPVLCRALEKKN